MGRIDCFGFPALIALTLLLGGCGSGESTAVPPADVDDQPASSVAAGIGEGWTKLPAAPAGGSAGVVWAGDVLIAWGGCPHVDESTCKPTARGFAFDPSAGAWTRIPDAPMGLAPTSATWTGREALFIGSRGDGLAYDPAQRSWRVLPKAPIATADNPSGSFAVWTGVKLIVWGGTPHFAPMRGGAAYDPASDSWSRIADAPLALNQGDATWTGKEMLVFGSDLDRRNGSSTRFAVGAAYDPDADSWRRIPSSRLSPQANSSDFVDGRLVAWDYFPRSQTYDPERDRWTKLEKMPLQFSECYPDSAAVGGVAFAFYCGQVASLDPGNGSWRRIHGGIARRKATLEHPKRKMPVWTSARLVPAGDTVFLLATGTLFNAPAHGPWRFPHSFWAYSPEG